MRLEIVALATIPEVRPGDDLGTLIREAAAREHEPIDRTAILAVAQKIVSKAEGALINLQEIQPSHAAACWAAQCGRDPRVLELVLRESRRIVRMDHGLIIAETRHGFICANAGVDQSNTEGDEFATVLPADPDASARALQIGLQCGGVIITDTFGRPWREGLVDVAIGVAGLDPLDDLRGTADRHGRTLSSTIMAVADQLAAAAGLLMCKSSGCPVVIVRGFMWREAESTARSMIRAPERDLFR